MSDKEKQILDRTSQLPDKLQDRFLDKLQGAADAVEVMRQQETRKEEGS